MCILTFVELYTQGTGSINIVWIFYWGLTIFGSIVFLINRKKKATTNIKPHLHSLNKRDFSIMAKPQSILAVHNDYVKHFKIAEGFNTYENSNFLREAPRYLSIRQRDYLDGVGVAGLKKELSLIGFNYVGATTDYTELHKQAWWDGKKPTVGDIWLVREENTLVLYSEREGFLKVTLSPHHVDINTYVFGDPNYRQILPYSVFKVKDKDLFFTYRRNAKVGEARLVGNCSIGFGGHVDINDVIFNDETSIVDLDTTIYTGGVRELIEEIKTSESLHTSIKYNLLTTSHFGLINDNSNEVGTLHLAVVNVFEVEENDILGVAEDELEYMGPMSAEDILNNNPESWTKLIVEGLCNS